ncbi:MAG: hypothetical protein ACRC2V_05140, partial [Xenococcaceae cyanobacterium]
YQLQKLNDDRDRENQFLENRLAGKPISDPQYVMMLEQRLSALEARVKPNDSNKSEGLSGRQLAEKLGTAHSNLSRWKSDDPRLQGWQKASDGKWYHYYFQT